MENITENRETNNGDEIKKVMPFVNTNKTLFIDFDGVLFNSLQIICELYNEDYQYYDGYVRTSISDLHKYDMSDMCPLATHEELMHYFNTPCLYSRYKGWLLNDDLYHMLTGYNLVCVTLGTKPNLRIKTDRCKRYRGMKIIGYDINEVSDKSALNMSGGILIDDSWKMLASSNADFKIHFGKTYDWDEEYKDICLNGKHYAEFRDCQTWADVISTLIELEEIKIKNRNYKERIDEENEVNENA